MKINYFMEQTGGHVYVIYSDVIEKNGQQFIISISDEVGVVTRLKKRINSTSILSNEERGDILNNLYEQSGLGEKVFFNLGHLENEKVIKGLLTEKEVEIIQNTYEEYHSADEEKHWSDYLKVLEQRLNNF